MDSDAAQGMLQKEHWDGTLQGFYGVLKGHEIGIYTKWKDCHQMVSGYRNPMFKKFETFADAVTSMIMKGKYVDGKSIGGKIGIVKETIVESPVVEVSNLSLDSPKSLLSTISSILGKPFAPPLIVDTSTPRQTRAWRTLTDTHPSLTTSSHAPRRVYQYVRELSGIQSTLYSPPPADDIPLPSFGDVPDSYLEAHGYSSCALLCVQHALDVSASGQQFVDNLSGRGLPVAEARWLWFIITGDNDF
ncbi:hypothetical protein F4604DRAFT_1915442 [Suillus subluteus]|nr:hypothetical protein F4604DRAFT_1915442 [Suillus subluteus]